MIPVNKHLSTDVLIVGGGIAGLSAAISARASGVGVLIAEKANTLRSGSGVTGNDHFLCYIPEKHGPDVSVIVKELHQSMMGANQDVPLSRRFLEKSFDIVKLWHSWGINMRIDDWTFMGHAFPGRPRIFLKYEGDEQKPILTREAKKAGAEILNHHMIIDLIRTENGIAGALALDVSGEAPSFAVIRAKCVILATGSGNRLYTSRNTPGALFCLPGVGLIDWETDNKRIGWDIIMLVGAANALGMIIWESGGALWIANSCLGGIAGLPLPIIIAGISLFTVVIHLLIPIAPALIAVLLPAVVALADNMGVSPALLALPMGFSAPASLLLPIETITLVTYPAGYYRMFDMFRPGALIALCWVAVMTALMLLIGRPLGLL